jgi:hypothetical protein
VTIRQKGETKESMMQDKVLKAMLIVVLVIPCLVTVAFLWKPVLFTLPIVALVGLVWYRVAGRPRRRWPS